MAVSLSLPDLEAAAGITSTVATRLLPVGTALVQQYAPNAPEAVQNEATIRVCGFLAQTPASTLRRIDAGSISIVYQAGGEQAALRRSGAMALLSPFKKRRAGKIG